MPTCGTNQEYACVYKQSGTQSTLNRYWTGSNTTQLMADYILGACSYFNLGGPWVLAIGEIEGGGSGNNWMQVVYPTAGNDFRNNFWTPNNVTSLSPTDAELKSINSLNAAWGAYWLSTMSTRSTTGYKAIGTLASSYNGWCSTSLCTPGTDITAYGWSVLFLAYGNKYKTLPTNHTFNGTQISIEEVGAPTTTTVYYSEPCTGAAGSCINVPSYGMYLSTLTFPRGRTSQSKQILLYANSPTDYVSGLGVDLYFVKNNINYGGTITQPQVTYDLNYAASAAQSQYIVVIGVGSSAASNLKARGLTAYSSYSAWSYGGFIDCGTGKTSTQAWTAARDNAVAANNAGF